MRRAATIVQKGVKSTLIYGPETPVQKQRVDFEEATPAKDETIILFISDSPRPKVKEGGSTKFQTVAPKAAKTATPVAAGKVGPAA